MQLKEIDLPEPYRETRHSRPEKRTWRARIYSLRKAELFRFFAAGVTILAVASCLIAFLEHHNSQLSRIKAKFTASEKRIAELENRAKRDASRQEHSSNLKRSKRNAPRRLDSSRPSGGAVYTRWGRRDCPQHGPSRLIYQGIGAGSWYAHTGGGSENLCLHRNISYHDGRYIDGNQGSSYIYGMEWRDSTWINPLFDLRDTMGNSIRYHSVPCALCLAEGRFGKVMIPGQKDCPYGWIYEYDGYIMSSGHSDKHSGENICVDRRPQVVPGTQGAQNGRHIYMVETQCTSLLCEPVVVGREISCVVCTL